MIKDFEGSYLRIEFDSIAEMASVIETNHSNVDVFAEAGGRDGWYGDVKSVSGLKTLAQNGWGRDLEEVLSVSEETIKTVERDFDVQTWQSYYDVSGSDVDVARYLSGEPENMIAYTMVETPRAGRVVTLVANVSVSGGVSTETIEARGKNICALVHALETLGIRTELYTSFGNTTDFFGTDDNGAVKCQITVKVKKAEEILDPAMVMFAYAHPAFFRAYMLTAMHELPVKHHRAFGMYSGGGYGHVVKLVDTTSFPEHTVVVDAKMRGGRGEWNPKMAKDFVVSQLKDLEMI